MSYSVFTTENFDKEAKRLVKKYKSLKGEINELIDELRECPTMGTFIGNNVYKIRLAVASKGKGKRGGARVMSHVKVTPKKVLLFSIYSKGEKDDISLNEINKLIKDVF